MKCGSTCAVMGLVANDMPIAVEAVGTRHRALLSDALKTTFVLATEMSYLRVTVDPVCGNFLLGV